MKIDRREFVEVLEKVSSALGTNVLAPEYQYFQISGDRIQTTDGTIIMDTAFSKDIGLNCSIPRDVLRLLASLDTKEVNLVIKNDTLEIKTRKLEGTFAILTPPKFQKLEVMDTMDMDLFDLKLIEDVVKGLGFCRFAASKDHAAGPRTGVQINKDTLFSTDRFRVLKWELVGDTCITCTVPIKFIDLLKKHQSRIVRLGCVNQTFIARLNDGTYISAALIGGEYPKLQGYLPDPSAEYKHVEFGNSLAMAIDRHVALLKDVDACNREIFVEVKEGTCTLTSEAPERSNLVEQVAVEMPGTEEISFSVNPMFLQEITNRCSSFEYFSAGLIWFKTEKFQYVMRANVVSSKEDSSKTAN